MAKPNKKKVCIVASSLSKGGAERSSANLSKMLFKLGYDVHLVTVLSNVDYEYHGELLNLGEYKDADDTFIGRIKRLIRFKRFLTSHNFDVIIDNRARVQSYREFIVSKFIYKSPTVYVIHNFNQAKSFTKYTQLNKWLYKNEYMTAVSQGATVKFRKAFNLKHISTVYNGFDFEKIQELSNDNVELGFSGEFIIFFGRIDDHHKNLKLLLNAFKNSKLRTSNVKLLILGNGPDFNTIKAYTDELKLTEDVVFKGFVKNPYPYVKKAKFTVLTSRFEGFPMIIPESLCLGIPVVSVDCESGPNEVIKSGFNGVLVENHNELKLAEAFDSLIFDTKLYQKCLSNTVSSIEKFSFDNVMESWKQLINTIVK